MNKAAEEQEFHALVEFIKQQRGFDFTGYKRPSLMRRVSKHMQAVGVERFGDYLDYLEVHPEEFTVLFNTVLINVTSFFRDPQAWEYLASEIIPNIVAGKGADHPIRVWSAGCASGEEAYTLAMVLAEVLGLERCLARVKIYATDVDEEALTQARQAGYNARQVEAVPDEFRAKYFNTVGDRYVFRSDPRRVVIFGRHDLMVDAPISRLDLLVCRNTLMYFNAEMQNEILARFHFALNNDGFLFLGKAEMLLTHINLFSPVNLKYRIFTKVPHPALRNHLPLLAYPVNPEGFHTLIPHVRLREAALDAVPIAQIIVDFNGNVVLANQLARTFFQLTPNDIGRPFRDLDVSYRPIELRSLIEEVATDHRPISLHEVEWMTSPSEKRYLEVRVTPLLGNSGNLLIGTSLTFLDVTRASRLQEELQRTHQELETAYEELQSTNEELETTNEELQSTVEELETTNEELQSTNEEMETLNEELQSTNEEVQTTNEELHKRTDELDRGNIFLESILANIRTGVVVIDRHLSIQVWNRRAEDLWGVRAEEMQGQSFLNLDLGLPVEQLKGPLRTVIAGESEVQEIVLDATNRRGKAIQCRVICTPLRDREKAIQGGVLLMEEWDLDPRS